MKCCENCTCYEEEWEYCFRYGNHAPKDGYCDHYREERQMELRSHVIEPVSIDNEEE